MGWGYGVASDGREIGYSVQAKCDFPGCDIMIDRGLGWCCGSMHESANDDGCGKYFCSKHLPQERHDCEWIECEVIDDD